MKFSIILTDNNRSKSYIQNLILNGFIPNSAIYLNPENKLIEHRHALKSKVGLEEYSCFFDENESVIETLEKNNIKTEIITTTNINDKKIIELCKKAEGTHIVYSGPGGQILRNKLLNVGKEFIHVHPGWLPTYKGSTTFYYSQLIDKKVSASVIYFREGIDEGPILLKKSFEIKEKVDFDYIGDPIIRTITLIDFFKNYKILDVEYQNESDGYTFYVIHPLLKHLSILSQGIKK